MTPILDGLNAAQREAVEVAEGPLLILAGPGSGKTRVITHRIAHLIRHRQVPPYRIVAVTFTNKAAREMQERLYRLLGAELRDLTIGTFHAVCSRLLRREAEAADLNPRFVIYDDDDQVSLVKKAMEELGVDSKRFAPRAILAAISHAKSELVGPVAYQARVTDFFEEVVLRVYGKYQEALATAGALDFDDLLMRAVELFQRQPAVLQRYQQRYLHVLVDEFQDTNVAQYALARLLAGDSRNLCVVGDPDQSIYSWRSADIRNILSFESDYPDAQVVFLEQNYRSTQNILDVAQSVIQVNQERREKGLWTEKIGGVPARLVEVYDEEEEACYVVEEVSRLVQEGHFRAADCAVMYRTNAQSRPLEEALVRYGVPYRLVAGTRFYERREVKDALAYLRVVANPLDSLSLARIINVPGRGIGARTVQELSRWANANGLALYEALQRLLARPESRVRGSEGNGSSDPKPETRNPKPEFSRRTLAALQGFLELLQELLAAAPAMEAAELLDLVLERSGYRALLQDGTPEGEERWDNLRELRTVALKYDDLEPEESLRAVLEEAALVSDVDSFDERVDALTLITLHAAKGLEFGVVFIVGMEESLLPHSRSYDDPPRMEEERRLCYVGITRARERLYLIRAQRRSFMGRTLRNPASRFLLDLPQGLVERHSTQTRDVVAPRWGPWGGTTPQWAAREAPGPAPGRAALGAQLAAPFESGARVRHATYGEGIVVGARDTRDDQELEVMFKGALGTRKFLASLANLERV